MFIDGFEVDATFNLNIEEKDFYVSKEEFDDLYKRYKESEEREKICQKIINDLRKRSEKK